MRPHSTTEAGRCLLDRCTTLLLAGSRWPQTVGVTPGGPVHGCVIGIPTHRSVTVVLVRYEALEDCGAFCEVVCGTPLDRRTCDVQNGPVNDAVVGVPLGHLLHAIFDPFYRGTASGPLSIVRSLLSRGSVRFSSRFFFGLGSSSCTRRGLCRRGRLRLVHRLPNNTARDQSSNDDNSRDNKEPSAPALRRPRGCGTLFVRGYGFRLVSVFVTWRLRRCGVRFGQGEPPFAVPILHASLRIRIPPGRRGCGFVWQGVVLF